MLHYEIHITVKTKSVEQFQAACKSVGVKPIILDLQRKSGDVLCDVMTSSSISVNDPSLVLAKKEMQRIVDHLTDKKFQIIRCKIETVPWHPDAPSNTNGKLHFPGSHYEAHLGVVLTNDEEMKDLVEIANNHSLHLSKNIFKKFGDGSFCQMATYRSYEETKEEFEVTLEAIITAMKSKKFIFEKAPKIEFAIFDTLAEHDKNWLN